jgi:hypothetical protein
MTPAAPPDIHQGTTALCKDKDIQIALNKALRAGHYSLVIFQERCSASLDALWREFLSQSRL